jgi:hypothetical protein
MKSLEGRFLALMRILYGSDGSGERCGFLALMRILYGSGESLGNP